MTITDEIASIFKRLRSELGAPVVEVELTDDQLCSLLELSVEEYAEKVQNWTIENNWANIVGKDLTNIDLAYALSIRTMDLSKEYSYWFSREVGVQQRGPWELKKDFFKIEEGKQNYVIPAGREIIDVLYCNPGTSQAALYANYGGLDTMGFAGGWGQAGGGSYGPIGGFYIAQSMDVAYMATDLQYKLRLLRGDMTFKVTAGPDGTHIIHLYSTPGSRLTFGQVFNSMGGISLVGCEVWYQYYDVSNGDADECRRQNPNIILSPDQIPLSKMEFGLLNEPTKVIVRKIFFSKAKRTLAKIRGKFSGRLSIMMAEAQMDYSMLIAEADKELDAVMKELEERLQRMSPYEVMKRNAEMVDNMIKIQGGKPLKILAI